MQIWHWWCVFSGGLKVTVTGTNLDAVQYPKMYIAINGNDYISDCKVTTSTTMICRSPNVSNAADLHSDTESLKPLIVAYGFIMDNVTDLKNLTAISEGERIFLIFPDPIFFPFDSGEKFYQPKNEYLTINVSIFVLPIQALAMYYTSWCDSSPTPPVSETQVCLSESPCCLGYHSIRVPWVSFNGCVRIPWVGSNGCVRIPWVGSKGCVESPLLPKGPGESHWLVHSFIVLPTNPWMSVSLYQWK